MNRSLHILLVFLAATLFVLPGCKPGTMEIQGGQKKIPREQMVRLMADMELTESALKFKQMKLSGDSIKKVADQSYDSLYSFYGVTPEQFKENLKYYQQDLEDFQTMTDEVIVALTKHKDSVSTFFKDPPPDTAKAKQVVVSPQKPVTAVKPLKK